MSCWRSMTLLVPCGCSMSEVVTRWRSMPGLVPCGRSMPRVVTCRSMPWFVSRSRRSMAVFVMQCRRTQEPNLVQHATRIARPSAIHPILTNPMATRTVTVTGRVTVIGLMCPRSAFVATIRDVVEAQLARIGTIPTLIDGCSLGERHVSRDGECVGATNRAREQRHSCNVCSLHNRCGQRIGTLAHGCGCCCVNRRGSHVAECRQSACCNCGYDKIAAVLCRNCCRAWPAMDRSEAAMTISQEE